MTKSVTIISCWLLLISSFKLGRFSGRREAVDQYKEKRKIEEKTSCALYEKSDTNYGLILHIQASIALCLEQKERAACDSLCSRHGYAAFCGINPATLEIPIVDCEGVPQKNSNLKENSPTVSIL